VKNVVEAAVNLALKQRRRLVARTRTAGESLRNVVTNVAKNTFRSLRRPVRRATRRKHQIEEQWDYHRAEWRIERELETLVARGRLIVLGPWLSEVGFETLYWLPFLHWLKAAFRLDPDRLVAVSRGGVGSWYEGVAARYVEVWDDIDPADFARRNAERGVTKQYERSPLDREVLNNVALRLGTNDFDVIHPEFMYRLFALYWSGHRAMGFIDAHTRFTRHAAEPLIDPALLPHEYVAVKLYAARSLPDTPEIRSALRGIVAGLAERMPVVLLDTGLVLEDDHADYSFASGRDVISARPWMTPQNNLGVQTQIVAGAKAFVGTCGSLAWLAPRLGVDTSAVYVDPKWLHAHLAVAMRAYHKLESGRFAVADLRALDFACQNSDVA
jgi:hypothetical protein